jgi:hypothetical protein
VKPFERPEAFTLPVAGESYKVFCYGLDLGSSKPSIPRVQVALAGFVPVGRLQSDSLAINPFWLAALVLAVTAGVLLWPFLKTGLMGPAEPLRVSDIVAVVLSLVLAVGLGVLVSLDTASYQSPRLDGPSDVDAQLERLADRLSDELKRDLDDGFNLLRELRSLPPELLKQHQRVNLAEAGGAGGIPAVHLKALGGYRFTQISWVSKDGQQFLIWAPKDVPPPMLNVRDREYFRAIRNDRAWSGWDYPFFVESVRSRFTGQVLAVFSAPMNVLGQPGEPPGEVVTVGMRPASVIEPVLPAGFDFAVIEPAGRVVFGSQPDRILEENFFEECQRPRRLRAAVQSRVRDAMDVRYWGRDHAMVTTPLDKTPWSLLVFFRKDQLRAAHFQALSVAATLFLAIVVLVALYASLARALTKEGVEVWFWPRDGMEHRLVLTAILLVTLGALLVGLASASGPCARLAVAACLPLLSVGAVVALLGVGGGRSRGGPPPSGPSSTSPPWRLSPGCWEGRG